MSKAKTNRVEMTFDLNKVSARDVAPHIREINAGKFAAVSEILALVATSCPERWGAPNEVETYARLPLQGDFGLAYEALQMAIKADQTVVQAKFDLTNITAAEYDKLNAGLRTGEPHQVATLLAEYVTHCDQVGDVDDVDAYLDLPYYTAFRNLIEALDKYGAEEMKNFQKRFTA